MRGHRIKQRRKLILVPLSYFPEHHLIVAWPTILGKIVDMQKKTLTFLGQFVQSAW
jgi:hypothetical protein